MAFISSVAESVGSSEAGLRLVLGQLLGYPVMMLYRRHIASHQSTVQHLYFIMTGQACHSSLLYWHLVSPQVCLPPGLLMEKT